MKFTALPLEGAFVVDLELISDHRGFNARQWCAREVAANGIPIEVVQSNVISNRRRGTLRGFHYQVEPNQDSKLFRVTRGAIFDVIIDLRKDSPTYREWVSIELKANEYRMLFVPKGFAQGFQTLEDDTELIYQVSAFYTPTDGRGIRHDDPAFAIPWPLEVSAISEADRSWPDFEDPDRDHRR